MTTKNRPRAIFSTNDFELLRKTVEFYIHHKTVENEDIEHQLLYLYHRLGRISDEQSA